MSGIACVMPEDMNIVDSNYAKAQVIYAGKRQQILKNIEEQNNISGTEFMTKLEDLFKQNMSQRIKSPKTLKEVKYKTIINHIYDAAKLEAESILSNTKGEINELKNKMEKIRKENLKGLEAEEIDLQNEVEKIVKQFAERIDMENLFNKYLPQVMSQSNQKLAGSQVLSYCKSIFKRQIYQELANQQITKAVKRRPAIILGYIREDALSKAATGVMKDMGMKASSSQAVGSKSSKIDILISLTEGATKISSNRDVLENLLKKLDDIDGTTISGIGESSINVSEFLGVQAKPWKLFLPTQKWNPMSIGSRAELFKSFTDGLTDTAAPNTYSWHKGVLFLSQHILDIMGKNTVLYAVGDSILWADALLNDMIMRYHKYFAFAINKDAPLSSHVVLADHWCR